MVDEDQLVDIQLTSKNINYYESKGYDIDALRELAKNYKYKKRVPRGTFISVKYVDLDSNSHAFIKVVCDYCGEVFRISRYTKKRNDNGLIAKDCCQNCRGNKISEIIIEKRKEKDSRFNHDKIRQEIIERDLLPVDAYLEKHTGSRKRQRTKVKFICNKHSYLGEQVKWYVDFRKGQDCRQCALERLSEKRRHDIEFIQSEFEKNNLILLSNDYTNNRNKLKFVCKNHPDIIQEITYSHLSQGQGCSYCSSSIGENTISKFLIENNYEFIKEKTFDDCINKSKLSFDFSIFINNALCLIEFDGEQHYRSVEYFGGQEAYEQRKKNDSIKNQYCLDNNIPLIRIPYWEFKNIESILTEAISDPTSSPFLVKSA